MANGGLITIYTLDFKFTKAMQGGREGNEIMEGAFAAEVIRADDADAAARVGKSRAKADDRIEGGAVVVGLENRDRGLEAAGIAQGAGGDRVLARRGWRVLES